jgi:hypothetical protein
MSSGAGTGEATGELSQERPCVRNVTDWRGGLETIESYNPALQTS